MGEILLFPLQILLELVFQVVFELVFGVVEAAIRGAWYWIFRGPNGGWY